MPLRGAYCLVLSLDSEVGLRIGRRVFELEPGVYVYSGSALSSLESRLKRHVRSFRGEKVKKFWNIDHLLPHAASMEIVRATSDFKIECQMVAFLKATGFEVVPHFGDSDCRSRCGGHLLVSKENTMATVTKIVRTCYESLGFKPESFIIGKMREIIPSIKNETT